METRRAASRIAVCALVLFAGFRLRAEILRVPADFPTIRSAVNRASDGDTVLVDDGVYLEKNIEIAADITVRSKDLFGAVVYGSPRPGDAIFIIKAAARIEGFVLKGCETGIKQRASPDVEWQASNLVLFDCGNGLVIDDSSDNVGSAVIRNVAVFGSRGAVGISTNDARGIDASGCLIMNCSEAFGGYDHLFFRVDDCAALDCGEALREIMSHRPVFPATSRIEAGEGVRVLSSRSLKDPLRLREFTSFLRNSVFAAGPSGWTSAEDGAAREAVMALVHGRIMLAQEDHRAAGKSFEAARRAAERAGSREFVWQALTGSARADRAGGNTEAALRGYKAAVDHLERWIPEVPVGLHRINFLEDKTAAFESLLALLFDGHTAAPARRYDEQAFFYAEKLKSLSGSFASSPRRPGSVSAVDLQQARDKAAAAKRIASLQAVLQDPDLVAPEKERLVSLLERAEEDYHGALVAEELVRRRNGGNLGRNGLPSPLDYPGVRDRLDGSAVISYVLGEEGSFAFLATEAGLSFARLPAAPGIVEMVEAYLRFLQLHDGSDFRGVKAGRLLFESLVGPFKDKLAAAPRRIMIIPDGPLHYLPFEALVTSVEGGPERARFWGGSVDISYATSATRALAATSVARRSGTDGPSARILAVGNSGDIRCDNRSRKLKQFFFPLSRIKKEIEAVARAFPGRDVTTLLDEEAGERALKAAGLEGFGIIHIASHGVIDDANWWRSALLLKPDARGDAAEDGFFTALEISELELDAGLVVLSGCGTGAGSLFKGEGIRGLSGAFRRAGADSLVVSLWSVDDRATAVFMGKFYRFLAGGDPPAVALGRTKREMIGSRYRSPFHWAPFVLVGEAGDRTIR